MSKDQDDMTEVIELFNGKSIDEVTLDDVEEMKQAYYEGDPKVSDEEYDEIIQKKFDGKDPTLGYDVTKSDGLRFEVKKHEVRMKGQEKVLSFEEYKDWINELQEFFDRPDLDFLVQYKLDGLSLSLTYDNGQLTEALLRGDGAQGEDIIKSALQFKGVKKLIKYKDSKIFVRGEIVLTQEDFEKIPLEKKANRRNVASGVARRIDPELAHYLSFVVWGIEGDIEFDTETQKIMFLRDLGFNVVKTTRSTQLTKEAYLHYGEIRDQLELLIDGLVIKLDDLALRDQLNENPDTQHGQVALKFPAMKKASTIKRVDWITGKTGKVCPTAVIEPINLLGSVIERVTLCSCQEIERLNLQLYEKVWVEKRGDVIPKIYSYDSEYATSPNQIPIEYPTTCPSCGHKLVRIGADLFCKNEACPAQLGGRIEAVFKTLEIKGFGETMCDQLVDSGVISKISQLFTMQPADLMKACGLREENATNLINRIQDRIKKGITIAELITCLQIPNIGVGTAAKIADAYSIEEVMFFADQGEIKKFTQVAGDAAGLALYKGILNMTDQINDILDQVSLVKPEKDPSEYHGAFCFTGFRDKELAKKLDDLGYKELNSVTKACTLLVSKDTSVISGKLKKAMDNGVRVISLAQLNEMLENGTLS